MMWHRLAVAALFGAHAVVALLPTAGVGRSPRVAGARVSAFARGSNVQAITKNHQVAHLCQSSFNADDAPVLDLKDVKAGDVIVFRTPPQGGDLVHELICKLTSSPFPHAALASEPLRPGKFSVETIESTGNVAHLLRGPRGVNFGTLTSEQYAVVMRRGDRDMQPVVDAAKLRIGSPYGFASVTCLGLLLLSRNKLIYRGQKLTPKALAVLRHIVRWLLHALQSVPPERTPLCCSQLVSESFSDAGNDFKLSFSRPVADTPGWRFVRDDLRKIIANAPGERFLTTVGSMDIASKGSAATEFVSTPNELQEALKKLNEEVEQSSKLMPDSTEQPYARVPMDAEGFLPGESITSLAWKLVSAVYHLSTGKEGTKKEVLDFIDGGNLESYLISPVDLCENCPSLNKVGVIRPEE
ncbi:unnamed protein product [Ectocarpus sp. 12 AP-2014]